MKKNYKLEQQFFSSFDKLILILILLHLIWQWANNIIVIINKFKILIYFDDSWEKFFVSIHVFDELITDHIIFNDSQKKFFVSICVLDELITDHVIFDDQFKYNWIIILSLYLILTQQHEFFAQSDWHKKIQKLCCQKIKKKYLILNLV